MEKRLILAIALSILIITSFQYFFGKKEAGLPPALVPEKTSPAVPAGKAAPGEPPAVAPILGEKAVEVETDKQIITFSNIGGAIKRVRLKDHKDHSSGKGVDIVGIKDPRNYLFSISGIAASAPLDTSVYEFKKDGNSITYTLKCSDLEVIKKFNLHNSNNTIELQLYIKNISDAKKAISYSIIGGSGVTESNIQDARFIELRSKIDGKITSLKIPKEGRAVTPGAVSWAALKNKYFSVILKPSIQTRGQFHSKGRDGLLVMGAEAQETVIPPSSFIENKFILYAGPSQLARLKEADTEFEETLNYGFFGGISKLVLTILGFFHFLVRNWGISIILLSVFLNLALSPLTFKSFKSMQKMQALHPQMEKLKAQCKDNPQKLNKEMLELYKKYKINPFSGCLPMLLQMPIFIALYNGLIRSVELRGAHFLWIKDLSLPDAVKIPVVLPILGNSVNILPLIMIAAMVVQQKMSTASMGAAVTDEQKQQQKMMLIMMPIMFGFIFYNMPSGLVLYWVVNTALTIVEQYAMVKNT